MTLRPRLCVLLLALFAGCGDRSSEAEPGAAESETVVPVPAPRDRAFVEGLRRARALPIDVSDGGGRVSWQRAPGEADHAVSGESRGYRLVYEAGRHGIAVGGSVLMELAPYWGWDTPQLGVPEAPGFTTLETNAAGVTLQPQALEPKTVRIRIGGRALAPGETLEL